MSRTDRWPALLRRRSHAPARSVGRRPRPIWFGPDDALAGFVHEPPAPGTHGTVICAPFGYESTCAYRSLRELADRLADAGQLVLRFDYEGAGASSGTGSEADLLDRWQASVGAAVAQLRAHGVSRPSLVGVRLGAALACAAVAADPEVGPVALWAPVTSGRRYVRELRAQAVTTPGGVVGDGSLNVVGLPVPAELAQALAAWNPLAGVDPRHPLLVVQSPEWRDKVKAADDFAAAGLHPDMIELPGTHDVLEQDAELAVVPHEIISALVAWIIGPAGAADDAAAAFAPAAASSAAAPDAGGTADRTIKTAGGSLHEQIVTVPGHDLYGVVTDPAAGPARTGVVFLNNGAAPAAGPGRSWVQFSRELAGDGVSALRFDMSGLGDSPDHAHSYGRLPRLVPRTAAHEVVAATELLRARGADDITVVGLCSGGQVALRTFAYTGHVSSVFAINPPLYHVNDIGVGPPMRRLWHYTLVPWTKRPIRKAFLRLPPKVWTAFDRLGIFPAPTRYLRRAIERGASVHLLVADGGVEIVDINRRAPLEAQQLIDGGQARIDIIEGLDHSMFDLAQRRSVLDALKTVVSQGGALEAPAVTPKPETASVRSASGR